MEEKIVEFPKTPVQNTEESSSSFIYSNKNLKEQNAAE